MEPWCSFIKRVAEYLEAFMKKNNLIRYNLVIQPDKF